jgi:hypothetical protein
VTIPGRRTHGLCFADLRFYGFAVTSKNYISKLFFQFFVFSATPASREVNSGPEENTTINLCYARNQRESVGESKEEAVRKLL